MSGEQVFRSVTCLGCEYANACQAAAAGFKRGECRAICPEPDPEVVCTMDYAPVKCDGCRYSNACVAGAAGFTKEQCAPVPGE